MSTLPTTFPTFEQWLADSFPTADRGNAENVAAMRKVYDRSRFVEEHAPTTIPPCPSWCALEAGHDYDSTLALPAELDYVRTHTSSTAAAAMAAVDQMEHNDGRGAVTLDEATVYVQVEKDLDAPGAIDLSDELRLAAALLRKVKAGEL